MWLANRRIAFGARGTSAGTLGPIGQHYKSHYIMYNDLTLKENHYSLTPLELDGFSVKKQK